MLSRPHVALCASSLEALRRGTMFYSQVILAKKGPLGKMWLAVHWDKKLTKVRLLADSLHAAFLSEHNARPPALPRAAPPPLRSVPTHKPY